MCKYENNHFKLLTVICSSFLLSCNGIKEILPSQNKIAAAEEGATSYIYPNINNGNFIVEASSESEQAYQLFVFDP